MNAMNHTGRTGPAKRACVSRRDFLCSSWAGLGAIAWTSRPGRRPPKAKHCIFLLLEGGPSHIDTFDPKPKLQALHMTRSAAPANSSGGQETTPRCYVRSPFGFRRAGKPGIEINENFRCFAEVVDEVCFYRGLQAASANHAEALYALNCGSPLGGEPALGAWVAHGLATGNEKLPAFVVLTGRTYPLGGAANWSCGFLPARCQGAALPDMWLPPGASPAWAGMPSAADLSSEPEATLALYGVGHPNRETDAMARRCLLARRLVERGVRFVQIIAGGWDSHQDIEKAHRACITAVDQPVAGLLQDLKRSGLLAETLVVWMGEFGRSPDSAIRSGAAAWGRDHNARAMTVWVAGAGVRRGAVVGATDELGAEAIEAVHSISDFRATVLHLLGLDPACLSAAPGRPITELLA